MTADISSILTHLGESINPVSNAIQALSGILGFMMVWQAIKKMKTIADSRARYTGGGRMFVPMAYLMGGATLFFLPSMIDVAKNTFFGSDSPIAYNSWFQEILQTYGNSTFVVTKMVQLAGLIWFIRGTVLLVHGSEPGVQHASKGFAFLIAGILSINASYTYNIVSDTLGYITQHTLG